MPTCFKRCPNNLPKAAPKMKVGDKTPAGIGDVVAKTVSMNFLLEIKLNI